MIESAGRRATAAIPLAGGFRRQFRFDFAVRLLAVALLAYLVLVGGGVVSQTYFTWQVVNLSLGVMLFVAWLIYRGIVRRANWPATGLEPALGGVAAAAALSWALSPDWRIGAARVFQLVAFALIFYVTLDLLDSGWPGALVGDALVVVSGLALALGLLEVYAYYYGRLEALFDSLLYRPVTLLGHPNLLMGLANLALPFVYVAWTREKSVWIRSGLLVWLLCYAAVLPFASSRGAMLGLAVMIVATGAWWWRSRHLASVDGLAKSLGRYFWLIAVAGLAVMAVLTFLFVSQSGHPSHGGLLSRLTIWQVAGQVVGREPVWGVGPGRFGFEAARFASTPPSFWPIHAHSVFWQTLGEFGIVGIAALTALAAVFARHLWKSITSQSGDLQVEAVAASLALLAYAAQNLVDDQTHVLATMIPCLMVCALAAGGRPLPRSRISMAAVAAPVAVVMALQATWLWAYASFDQARQLYEGGDKEAAYALVQEAGRLDPGLAFYDTSAGLLAAELGAWPAAREHFERALQVEDGIATTHANLAVSLARNGEGTAALNAMQTAATLAPAASTVVLMAGDLAERVGDEAGARRYYGAALAQRPDWRKSDFWAGTSLRQEVREAFLQSYDAPTDPAAAVELALLRGDHAQALQLLEEYFQRGNRWPPLDIRLRLLRGDAALTAGRLEEAMRDYEAALFALAVPSIEGVGYSFWNRYGIWLYERQPLPLDAVPGLRPLDYDREADLTRFERLATWAAANRACAQAQRIQRALLAIEPGNAAAMERLREPCP